MLFFYPSSSTRTRGSPWSTWPTLTQPEFYVTEGCRRFKGILVFSLNPPKPQKIVRKFYTSPQPREFVADNCLLLLTGISSWLLSKPAFPGNVLLHALRAFVIKIGRVFASFSSAFFSTTFSYMISSSMLSPPDLRDVIWFEMKLFGTMISPQENPITLDSRRRSDLIPTPPSVHEMVSFFSLIWFYLFFFFVILRIYFCDEKW